MLNILSLLSFANAVFLMFLSIYSIAIDHKSAINRASSLECFLLGIWSFAYTFFYVAPTKEAAWFWLRFGSIGWGAFMGALIWFFLELTRYNRKKNRVVRAIIIIILPTILVILNLIAPYTSPAVDLVQSKSGLGWTYVNRFDNVLSWAYIIYILIGVAWCADVLRKWLNRSKSIYFKRIALAFLMLDGILIIAGFILDLIVPKFTDVIPPITNIVLIIFSFSYWIIVFQLEVFRKDTLEASEFILDIISDALLVLDDNDTILHCNKAASELLQYDNHDIIGEKLIQFFLKDSYDQKMLDQLIRDKKLLNIDADLVTGSGSIIHVVYSASIAEDEIHGFMGVLFSFHDITQQKNLEKRLYELAHYDSLTGLPNRRYFIDLMYSYEQQYYSNNKDFAIFFIDLDGFKKVNDTMGHDKGDLLLIEIGRRLSNCIDAEDVIARIGGDEFILLQSNVTDMEQIFTRKERILNQFEDEIIIEEQKYPIALSVGYAIYSKTKSVPAIMAEADQHMYKEKLRSRRDKDATAE